MNNTSVYGNCPNPDAFSAVSRASKPPIEVMWRLIFQKGVTISVSTTQPIAAKRNLRIRKAIITSESIIRQLT